MLFDVTIVGGGPAGLFAAFYAGLRDLKTKIIEADVELGGRLRYYPEKLVWDVGGLPPTKGGTLRANLEAQAQTFNPEVITGRSVAEAEQGADGTWTLTTDQGEVHHSRTVILAIGYGTLGTRRLMVPGASLFEGDAVHYSLRDPREFQNRRVVISGGGNSAVDWAHQLAGVAASVTLVHRREEFRAHEHVVAQLEAARVQVLTPWKVTQLEACGSDLGWVHVEHETGWCERLEADALFVGHGMDFASSTGLMKIRKRPGVYCAGDCIDRVGKANLIAATFPEAVEAVNAIKLHLDPNAATQPMVSSHNPKFVELR